MSYLFSSTGTLRFGEAVNSVSLQGSLANEMYAEGRYGFEPDSTFNDPMHKMLDGIHEIAFRASVRAGKDNATVRDAPQVVPYTGLGSHIVYATNIIYMALATAVSILNLVAAAATFYGWWELRREMSMSPLEIAKAFDAPLLREVGSNVRFNKMERGALMVEIRYGQISKDEVSGTGNERVHAGRKTSLRLHEDAEKPLKGQNCGP